MLQSIRLCNGKTCLVEGFLARRGYEPGGDIYQRLRDKQVPYIANLVSAHDGSLQCCGWFDDRLKATRIGQSIRHRLVLDTIGVPISRFPSTWIMVNAIHCALIGMSGLLFISQFLTCLSAHEMAFKYAKILHRDISVGNRGRAEPTHARHITQSERGGLADGPGEPGVDGGEG
ncbi:hypothetical protein BDZ89DRAFT_1069561 [Hymenopellis radicata]|nr:hypothetical protein BDZ89DRAFT_1069561 [Hymenopellis radicata]